MADSSTQSDAQEPDTLLKVSDVAKMFNVTSATVRIWLSDGTLKGVKIGRGYYWRIYLSEARKLAKDKYGDNE